MGGSSVDGFGTQPLRTFLKQRTAASHERLDRSVDALVLAEPGDYARFLHLQLAARAPIERWAARHCPPDLRPPETADLLREDLRGLGTGVTGPESRFEPPPAADPLGLAWAIAGSHMGNRAMLVGLTRAGAQLPCAFLADPRMGVFWSALRPRLEAPANPASAAHALDAAEAVFACFALALSACQPRKVA